MSAVAQDNAENESFARQIWPITNTGFYPSKVSDAAMWYSTGSSWTLEKSSGKIPESLKAQLESFTWNRQAWEFETPHCYPENRGHRKKVFAATFDLDAFSPHRNTPIILKPRQKSFSGKKHKDCGALDNRKAYDTLSGSVQLSWAAGNPDVYETLAVSLGMPNGEVAWLYYRLETSFSALSQTNWQWDISSETLPKNCGLLRVSPLGYASTSCCNSLYFELKKNETGWASTSGGGTQVGCGPELMAVDNQFFKAMPQGMTLGDDGTLIIGTSDDARITLRPVDRFEKAYGQWVLSGLEMRSMNSPIRTRPRVRAVTSRQALMDMNITLGFTPEGLKLSSECGGVDVPIVDRVGMFIRLGKGELERSGACSGHSSPATMLFKSFPQITGERASLYVEHDQNSGDLTFTRVQLGSNYRSVSWIFSPAGQ